MTLSWGAGLQMLPVLHQHQKEEEEHGEWGWHICRAPHPINLPPSYLHHALGQRPAERGCSGQCRRLLRFAPRMARSKPVGKQIKNLGSDGDREESYPGEDTSTSLCWPKNYRSWNKVSPPS